MEGVEGKLPAACLSGAGFHLLSDVEGMQTALCQSAPAAAGTGRDRD